MPARIDIAGKKFGRLTALERVGKLWKCLCDCGSIRYVAAGPLRYGRPQSCGCLNVERRRDANIRHGYTYRSEHQIWLGMIQRCRNKNHPAYARYGGRGIGVCRRWLTFENFIKDVGDRPSLGHSLDRINNDKGYAPSNCRWSTDGQQARNARSNRRVRWRGRTMSVAELAEMVGMNYRTLLYRLNRKWSVAESVGAVPRPQAVRYRRRSTREAAASSAKGAKG